MNDVTYDPASHYDRVTAAWRLLLGRDLHYGVFTSGDESLPEATHALTTRMAEAASVAPAQDILDVGCGTGGPAVYLAGELGATVVGITTSSVGVDEGRTAARTSGLANQLRFELRDGMDNGFPDTSFDCVWALESSHLMRDRDRLMAECARVLRPGGTLVLCDIMLRSPMPFVQVRRLREPLRLLRNVFGDARMEPLSLYVDLSEECGLRVDLDEDLTALTRPTFQRWRDNAETHREQVEASLGPDGWSQFVESCNVLEGFWDDGTLGYGLLAARKPA